LKKTTLAISLAILAQMVYMASAFQFLKWYAKQYQVDLQTESYAFALVLFGGLIVIIVLALGKIVRIRYYKASYLKSLYTCFLILFVPMYLFRLLTVLVTGNFLPLGMELQMIISLLVLSLVVSLITAVFFTKNKYRPQVTGVLDEHEVSSE
jgi:hypothetical protein